MSQRQSKLIAHHPVANFVISVLFSSVKQGLFLMKYYNFRGFLIGTILFRFFSKMKVHIKDIVEYL